MNHESYLDPPLAGIASGREMYFLARKTLLDVPVLGWLLPRLNVVPVDQEGNDRSALKALDPNPESGQRRPSSFPKARGPSMAICSRRCRGSALSSRRRSRRSCRCEFSARMKRCRAAAGALRFVPITIVVGEPMHFTEADLEPRRQRTLPAI